MDESIPPVNQIDANSSSFYALSNQNENLDPDEAELVKLRDDLIELGVEREMNGMELDHQFNEKNVFSNRNETEVISLEDVPMEVVEMRKEDLKIDHQFNEENVFSNPNEAEVGGHEDVPMEVVETIKEDLKTDHQITNSQEMEKSIVPVNQIAIHSSSSYESSNQNKAEVVGLEDVPVEVVETIKNDLKIDHQFNEENVPEIFHTLVNKRIKNLKTIDLQFLDQCCLIKFGDIEVCMEEIQNSWLISYNDGEETMKSDDPEKFIVDHLWFVLKNPNIKLLCLKIGNVDPTETTTMLIDFGKLNSMLQLMLGSIDHQIQTCGIWMIGFNEDTFLSMLQHIKPGTLIAISVGISWKEDGNYQKMKEIVETDQWKQAKTICSFGIAPLKIKDFLHCETFWVSCDDITPEDVLRVRDHFFNSKITKNCHLKCKDGGVDRDDIRKMLFSSRSGNETSLEYGQDNVTYTCEIPNSQNSLSVELNDYYITFERRDSL